MRRAVADFFCIVHLLHSAVHAMRRQQQKLSGELTILLDSLVVFKNFLSYYYIVFIKFLVFFV